ncbi:hypothetical protein AFAE65S_00469 [Alcaligenes phenolicus]
MDTEEVIYRKTIRLKNGRIIRRANGGVFRIVLRKKNPTQ